MGDRMSSSLIGRTNKKRIPTGYSLFISSNGQLRDVYSHTGYAKATDADYDGARAALKAVSD